MSFSLRTGLIAAVAAALCSFAQATTILVDYGDTPTTATPPTWNNQGSSTLNATLPNLVDTTGAATGIKSVASGFNGFAVTGGMPSVSGAASTAFYGQGTASTDYVYTTNTGTLTLSNLDPNTKYTFTVLASRNSSGSRAGQYTATGSNSATGTLESIQNSSNVLVLSDIRPNASNTITLSTQLATGNTSGFAYLNAIRIDTAAVPEPAALGMVAMGALACLKRRRSR